MKMVMAVLDQTEGTANRIHTQVSAVVDLWFSATDAPCQALCKKTLELSQKDVKM